MGLHQIHKAGIIHRDLKLGNLLIDENMILKIADFGLAKKMTKERSLTVCGTPNYISPEVLDRNGHSFPADIWAVGVITYTLLIGTPPFEGE
jgi:serine/threonine protein kinase